MKPIVKPIALAVIAFVLGLTTSSFLWYRAVSNSERGVALAMALENLSLHMWAVERIEENRTDEVVLAIDTTLCDAIGAARATIAAARAEGRYANVVERAEARVQMLLERESPESMPGYDRLVPCAKKGNGIANASPPQMARAVAAN